jgi:hypothetical protein
MPKPENTFIASIHRHFPQKDVPHREKNANPYRGGTADCWYSGRKADMWIEYKFVPRVPKRSPVPVECSTLQLEWLRGRYAEGRNVHVIVGCSTGGVVLSDLAWEHNIPIEEFSAALKSRQELAQWILKRVEGEQSGKTIPTRSLRADRTTAQSGQRTSNVR